MNRAAKISFKNEIAGRLEETARGGTRFIYHENWQTPIGCSLPVRQREHEWNDGLHPFFQHLGAEGWLRERQARVAHIAEEDDFGLLLRYGADCIGAVGVLPDDGADIAVLPDALAAGATPGRTVSGVQRKLLVVLNEAAQIFEPAASTGPAPFIAKFNSERPEAIVRNEYLSLRWMAALLGADEVTAFALGRVAGYDEGALVVTRFDRTQAGEKLRAEDFAQILNKPRGIDFGGKYDASYEQVAEIVRNYSARPEIDLLRLFRRLIAFAIIANCDAHLKNFTLLETPAGLRLSPIYDVINVGCYAQDGFAQELALRIGDETVRLDDVNRRLFETFGERIGLPARAVARAFADLRQRAPQANAVLDIPRAEYPIGFVARFDEVVRNGCLRILEQ